MSSSDAGRTCRFVARQTPLHTHTGELVLVKEANIADTTDPGGPAKALVIFPGGLEREVFAYELEEVDTQRENATRKRELQAREFGVDVVGILTQEADDNEAVVILDVAVRAGLLWRCQCK